MLDAVRTDPPPRSLRLSGGVAASPEADVASAVRLASRVFDCWSKASCSNRQGEPCSREDLKYIPTTVACRVVTGLQGTQRLPRWMSFVGQPP